MEHQPRHQHTKPRSMCAMFVPMFKIPTIPTALFVAGLLGLACTSSGAKSSVGDGAVGGQAGSTSSGSGGCGQGCVGSIEATAALCDSPLLCNPGDTLILAWDASCGETPNFCYDKTLCAQSFVCETWRTTTCSGTSSDGGLLGTQGAPAGGSDAGRIPCCGDGILDADHGEQCDLGPLNGVRLDANGNPTGPGGCMYCSTDCIVPSCFE